MESVISGQVLGVESRQSRNGQHTMYDVAFSDGNKYTTFDANLAQTAANLSGQAASAKVSVDQRQQNNRTYTNFNLLEIGPPGSISGAAAQPIQGGVVGPGVIQPAGGGVITPAPQQGGGGGGRGFTPEDKARVSRFAAQGTAFAFVATIYSGLGPEALPEAVKAAKALTEELLNHGQTGLYRPSPLETATTIIPTATTPQEVAEQVPGVTVGVQQDAAAEAGDDIPWD